MTTGILSLSDSCLYPPYTGNEAASVLENTAAQGVFGSDTKCEGSQLHNLQTDVAKVGICVLRMQTVFTKKKNTKFWKKQTNTNYLPKETTDSLQTWLVDNLC